MISTKLSTRFWRFVSPQIAYRVAARLSPWLGGVCFLLLILGLYGGLYLSPADYQQGEVYRIMYVHVPSAAWSLGIYALMTVFAVSLLVWKPKVMDALLYESACIGAVFTFLALLTGSIWGKPTWGAWWVWDARLTSELILLFIYLGIILIRNSIPAVALAQRVSAILTVIGAVNIPIVHYSVRWWHTLHQGPTLLRLDHPTIAPSMLWPLLVMMAGFFFYYLWMLSIRLRASLLLSESNTQWVRDVQRTF